MYIVERITGGGYDMDVAGHYETLEEAKEAVAAEVSEKKYNATSVFVELKNMYIFTANTPYYLEYQIKEVVPGGPLR